MPLSGLRVVFLAIPALLLFAAVGVACGGGSSATKSTTPDIGGTGSGTAPAALGFKDIPAGAPVMDQENLTFKPAKLAAKVGEKVYMKNSESALHTVNLNGKNESGNMKLGAVFVWTPTRAGQYKVTCDYHPQMNAVITVE